MILWPEQPTIFLRKGKSFSDSCIHPPVKLTAAYLYLTLLNSEASTLVLLNILSHCF